MAKKRVAIALSGGIDSSVAALLLQQAGYNVIGITMRLWAEDNSTPDGTHYPYPAQDIHDAEQVCHTIGIPFHIIDLEKEFKQYVIDYFYQEYTMGRTPNPCIACNQYIKFGSLLKQALYLGADYLATGHYARIMYSDNSYHLLKGIDLNKDQSYVLYTLRQNNLSRLLLPLGSYYKTEIQDIARRKGLPTAGKKSSQDICFIATSHDGFTNLCLDITPGEIINNRGNVVGKHKGAAFYTIGQRHGLGFATGERIYVTKIESATNRITVGNEEELDNSMLAASKVNWVSGKPLLEPMTVTAKIRYRSTEVAATLYPEQNSVKVKFYQPQRAIAPGQAIVFYQGSKVLGGGTIEN